MCVAQADLSDSVPATSFDKVFCYGVLQHTPDPRVLFHEPGAVSQSREASWRWMSISRAGRWSRMQGKHLYRPLTTRDARNVLFRMLKWYIPKWLPLDTFIKRLPLIGRVLGMGVPLLELSLSAAFTHEQQVEWAILDTFDALAPVYDDPQTPDAVTEWFRDAHLTDVRVRIGATGCSETEGSGPDHPRRLP